LVKQMEIAYKEEKEAYTDSVSQDKCINHLHQIACCGNYQKVLAELAEASMVLQQILEDRSTFVVEETARVEATITRLRLTLNNTSTSTDTGHVLKTNK
jgi:hypothetical protein